MSKKIKWAFKGEMIVLSLDKILPVKSIKFSTSHSNKYNSILASIKEVGLVEPLVVFPEKGRTILHEVAQVISAGGFEVDEFHQERGRLDEVFRNLTTGAGASGEETRS